MNYKLQKVHCDDIHIQTAQWPGRGATILAVHGITANCMVWKTIAEAVVPEYRLVAMDLRGRGFSDKPDTGYSISHHISDLYNLINSLETGPVILMGHSLGAFISLAFATQYPLLTKALILVDGGGSMAPEKWSTVARAIQPTKDRLGKLFSSREEYLQEIKALPYFQPWNQARSEPFEYELIAEGGRFRCGINPEHIREEAANIRKMVPGAYYPQVSCKTLIIRATRGLMGKDDILLPNETVERMEREIAFSESVCVPGVNHYSILSDQLEKRDQAILSFLSKI